MKLTKALLLIALCVFAQGVAGDGDDSKCEVWVGDGGCDSDCKFPFKCCCVIEPVCKAECPDELWCVHDPEWCVDKLVEKCTIEPKCVDKSVCHKEKHVVCKDDHEKRCKIVKQHVCKHIDDCKDVPVKKCDKVCDWKNKCDDDDDDDDDDDGRSVARGRAFASGDDSASATSLAFASDDDAFAKADADATGDDDAFAFTDTFARVRNDDDRRRLLGCKRVHVCDDKCHTVYERKCGKKEVCEEVPKEVCTVEPVKKCHDEWKEVCKKECDWVNDRVCKFVKGQVCKEEFAKCGPATCKEREKCNPECCPDTKVAKCMEPY